MPPTLEVDEAGDTCGLFGLEGIHPGEAVDSVNESEV